MRSELAGGATPPSRLSGIIVESGAGPGPEVGDEVVGTVPPGHLEGSRIVCRRLALARKPAALAHAEAAVLAGAGAVALRALRLAGTRPGDRILITGAGTDAGALALQIARVRGAHVTALCQDRDVPRIWDLGADDVRASDRAPGDSQPFAAIIDTDGSISAAEAARLLAPDGRRVALVDGAIADPGELAELIDLADRHGVFPLPR
jgi:NADPH:quinone reductase-like Zn-dependent oxidoreductase